MAGYLKRIILYLKEVYSSPTKFFVIVTALFGSLFLLITPPLQAPDEQSHFVQAYRVSEGRLSVGSIAGNYPISISKTLKTVLYDTDIRFDSNQKYDLHRTKAALNIHLDESKREETKELAGTSYSPVVYLPQAIMIALGRGLDLSPILLIYLARLGNLIAWTLIVYLAIRLLPVGKWSMAAIAVLPMAAFQAAVVTTDSLSMGILFVYVAFVVRLVVQRHLVTNRQYVLLAIVATALAFTKLIMVVFLPIALLLIFRKRTTKTEPFNWRAAAKLLLVIIVPVLLLGSWMLLNKNESALQVPDGVNAAQQTKLMFTAPQKFSFALWNTYFYPWSDSIVRSVIGTFGWMDTPMSLLFVVAGYFSIAAALLANRGDDLLRLSLMRKAKLLLWSIGLIYFLGVNAAMYIYYSPVDFNIIIGVQGRYFLPLFALLILLTINNNQLRLKSGAYNLIIKTLPLLLLSVSGLYLIIRYYFDTRI
jgi:uncharacterized membrane protein